MRYKLIPAVLTHIATRTLRSTMILVLSSFSLLTLLSSCVSMIHPISRNDHPSWRDFSWQYDGNNYNFRLQLSPVIYKEFRSRTRLREYDLFASDYFSKTFIKKLTMTLYKYGTRMGVRKNDLPRFIVSFVQNLPYTSDDVTTGHDEYPRFPYETLYDNGGDCEDTSILASAMLYSLGYDVALLRFPRHMAVGIKCRPNNEQSFYQSQGISYCYLETTGKDWDIGVIPPQIKDSSAQVKPIITRPSLLTEFVAKFHTINDEKIVGVEVLVTNLGSQRAQGITILISLRESPANRIKDQIRSQPFHLVPEDTFNYKTKNLRIRNGVPFRIFVEVQGINATAVDAISSVQP